MSSFVVNEFPEVPNTLYVDIPEGVVILQKTDKGTEIRVLGMSDTIEIQPQL